MKYVLASNNKDKMVEMKRILEGIDIISQSEAGLHLEVEETGTTFAENALLKAKAACDALNMPAIADDSGICVDALGGAPRVYSARYGGEGLDDVGRLNLLLKNMENEENRAAKFVCSAYVSIPTIAFCTGSGIRWAKPSGFDLIFPSSSFTGCRTRNSKFSPSAFATSRWTFSIPILSSRSRCMPKPFVKENMMAIIGTSDTSVIYVNADACRPHLSCL